MLALPEPPEAGEKCEFCQYREQAQDLTSCKKIWF